jgi:hypothetical protein
MKAVVTHGTTREKAIEVVDRSANNLFDFGSRSVILADQTHSWNGPVMNFSVVVKAGFIALPLAGTVTVDDVNVTIECELPGLVKNFIGEDKLRGDIERHVSALLAS